MNRMFLPVVAVVALFVASSEAKAFGLLNRMMGGCCDTPACCEATCAAAEPACGCAAEPACGCAAEPACGCANTCCDSCCHKCCRATPVRDLLARIHCRLHELRCCRKCCNDCCEPACGCAAEPACGCAAEPACGCAK